MRILIYGAGVLGSFYAAKLAEGGLDVSILARGQRLSDIRRHGIVLEEMRGGRVTTTHVRTVEQLAPEDAYDLVLVFMRASQVPGILPFLASNEHTPSVVFLGNNAAGPGEMVEALGPERVLMGFGGTGGVRDGHVVRHLAGSGRRGAPIVIGELDGRTTPRLRRIAETLGKAGVEVSFSPNIEAYLKTHVALVSPLANAIYMAGGDNHRLARTRDAVVLCIRAIREGFKVLRAVDVPIEPSYLKAFEWVPEPVLAFLLGRLMDTEFAAIGVAGHANVARDEFRKLAEDFEALARAAAVPTPAIQSLSRYIDPDFPVSADGSSDLAMDWGSVCIGLAALAGVLFVSWLRRSERE